MNEHEDYIRCERETIDQNDNSIIRASTIMLDEDTIYISQEMFFNGASVSISRVELPISIIEEIENIGNGTNQDS
ncbi:MAG: hypothetical protein MK212_07470 [Saprospiraceae bacterium]|uniref:hypothetical protein n=1 Tax=Kordia sp. TaxID=1965332 RepID=UPI0025BD57C8|nr:hypothetical protein [Kordia sp.]MCH2043969.1 hypothetical protein [Saprospiraceae bacterium]MCH2196825.1 hypothetical protein [Kordia sp.]